MSRLIGPDGAPVALGDEIGRGGEGAVYRLKENRGLVVKVYHKPVPADKAAKLEAMASMRTDDLSRVTAWPEGVVWDERRAVRGLLMPAVDSHKEAHSLYTPRSRRAEFSRVDYRFLVHSAMNVARAFAVVHAHGHVVGDVNHSGVLVSPKGTVRLIDCDSFQVRAGTRTFRCGVGVPEYTPPELHGRALDSVDRTRDHDAFGLAVMVFHLLFMGRHPFAGRFQGPGAMPIDRAIREQRFAYGRRAAERGMDAPPNTPSVDSVSGPLARMFEAAFLSRDGALRPTAPQWAEALSAFGKGLRACRAVPHHVYRDGMGSCPWCAIESATGVALFSVPWQTTGVAAGAVTTFDLAAAWAQIEREGSPLVVRPPAASGPSPDAVALRARYDTFRRQVHGVEAVSRPVVTVVGVGLILASLALLGVGQLWGLVSAVIGLWGVTEGPRLQVPPPRSLRADVSGWRKDLKRLTQERASVASALDRLGPDPFAVKLNALAQLKDKLVAHDAAESRALRDLDLAAERRQREAYLARFPIARCTAKGIGPGRRQMLISYGITTAADVSRRSVLAVPGFGSELASRLHTWRREIENRFRFDPSQKAGPAEVRQVKDRFGPERMRIQRALIDGPAELRRLREDPARASVVAQLTALDTRIEALRRDLAHIRKKA